MSEPTDERIYPCAECGTMRSKAEGGTTFTICDACWDRTHPSGLAELPHCSRCGVVLNCDGSDKEHESALRTRVESLEKALRTLHRIGARPWMRTGPTSAVDFADWNTCMLEVEALLADQKGEADGTVKEGR